MTMGAKMQLSKIGVAAFLAATGLLISAPASAQDTTPSQSDSAPAAPEKPAENAPASPDDQAAPDSPSAPEAESDDAASANDARPVDGDPLAISTEIVLLRVIGPWTDGDSKGFSRVVSRVSGGKLNLYVQWIGADGKTTQTAEVDGAQNVPQLALSEIRVEAGDEDSGVYFDTPEDAQGFRETYVLIIGRPGEARFGPATN
jgi:hypothetical protein